MNNSSETTLDKLLPNQKARVMAISNQLDRVARLRLMDLGFVPNSLVEVSLVSPMNRPKAYLVRGSLIVLRDQQASFISIKLI